MSFKHIIISPQPCCVMLQTARTCRLPHNFEQFNCWFALFAKHVNVGGQADKSMFAATIGGHANNLRQTLPSINMLTGDISVSDSHVSPSVEYHILEEAICLVIE